MSSQTRVRDPFTLRVENVSGHKKVRAAGVSPDITVAELTAGLTAKMDLPDKDPEGRPVSYHVRSDREGRHLHSSEVVGDVLQPGDRIVLQPNIQAG